MQRRQRATIEGLDKDVVDDSLDTDNPKAILTDL
eukprot:COSAG02_NODE_71006_length_189_cov_687.924731_1_plen_33_part_10